MDLASQAAGIGALADDTRRALYEYVVAQARPVGREEAAAATGVAQHNANFHLDRLVTEGLLEVEFKRLSGRTGPGAGRPSKLYRRGAREFAVSLPARRYDLVGDILALGVANAGQDLPGALREAALAEGAAVGRSTQGLDLADELAAVARVLATQGYEPSRGEEVVELHNCPFDALAQKHTELVCGLNRDFVEGVAQGLGCSAVAACLEPSEDQCCVKIRPARE